MWRRWKGQSLCEIGRAFGKCHSSIRCVMSLHGGFLQSVDARSWHSHRLSERSSLDQEAHFKGNQIPIFPREMSAIAQLQLQNSAVSLSPVSYLTRQCEPPSRLRRTEDREERKDLTIAGVSYRTRILGSHCFVPAAARCSAAAAMIFSISSGSRGSLRLSSS